MLDRVAIVVSLASLIIAGVVVIIYLIKEGHEKEYNILEDLLVVNVNQEALQKHALEISNYYSETKNISSKRTIIRSLDSSYKKIIKAYEYIDKDMKKYRESVPAAEWLLDNLYLIEKEYKDIRNTMPRDYYNNLPVITRGIMKGYPRIYHIAVELVTHSDGNINEENIDNFINYYQKNRILNSGELWAFPIMLKIALIQNISKISERIVYSEKEKKKGDHTAERLLYAVNEKKIDEEIKKLSNENISFNPHYVERLLKVLRDNGIESAKIYKWIDEKLESNGTAIDKMINLEHQKQACFQLSIGNCITSIREIGALNWRRNFEKLSFVENILINDPSRIYEKMDFESRDYYRHKTEKLANKTKKAESFIAKKAVECAEEAKKSEYIYKHHIGYYLIDDGVKELLDKTEYVHSLKDVVKNFVKKKRENFYIITPITLTFILCSLIIYSSYIKNDNLAIWKYLIAFIAILIPCSEIVVSIFNWSINHISEPRFVPKMEFNKGIPEDLKTVVVIPTILNSEKRVHDLISDMEVYYLANMEKNLYFALLADFKDSDSERDDLDDKINEIALKDIRTLNQKYGTEGDEIFYFFNRTRQYNDKEKLWIGWERKRGKLEEFNKLIRGDKNTSYNVMSSKIDSLLNVKYVITLDADTQLPIDTARNLIGAMSHILNIPYIDKVRKKVTRGYGLMQPRVSVGTIAANKTMFSKVFSGETGIDVYSTATSDVYQDLFGEGIFTGKGIYDVDIFNFMLSGQIPENSVLSHDLLEGSFVRTALVTDLELIDGYPAYYNSSISRLHRWVRGDWQLLPWLFRKTSLNKISKWKIFDNLRRSLITPSIVILIILSLSLLDNDDIWMVVAFVGLLCPILFDVSENVVSPLKGISLSGKINNGKMIFEQVFLIFCFLPYNAYMMMDAIVRTLYRVYVSKKNLLEWKTAADVEAKSSKRLKNYILEMDVESFLAIFIEILAYTRSERVGLLMLPTTILWFISPYIAYYISLEETRMKASLNTEQISNLRQLTRKTWAYFEDFIGSENNWLAPDNFQEEPSNGLACRTSPTNIGMGLSSNIVAYDMGYIGISELSDRLDRIINNLESLERYEGHFYNWYDTKTKEPLCPRYISTVDSGNLVGYLWMIEAALSEYLCKPIFSYRIYEGIEDLLIIANKEIEDELKIRDFYCDIIAEFKQYKFDIVSLKKVLLSIWSKTVQIEKSKDGEKLYWNKKVKHSVCKYLGEIQKLFPWSDSLIEAPEQNESVVDMLKEISFKSDLSNLTKDIDEISMKILVNNKKMNMKNKNNDNKEDEWNEQLRLLIINGKKEISAVINKIESVKNRLNNMVEATNFKILFNSKRQLFAIGYDIENDTIGNCYYDLLASEARQASFIAIAKGDIEQKHWFKLGRSLTLMNKGKGLVSWSGTMFEYLMPLLIMKNYPDTLLNETYKAVVSAQKQYGIDKKVPWGISESAYYHFDLNYNYQYKAFGIPGAGLKRGLGKELVISPYSTVMAMQVDLIGGYNNILRLLGENLGGRYGLYEAVDYTKDRIPKGRKKAIVKCFMVHHQGMSLMALDNVINYNILQERFHSIPKVKAAELLLQERVPRTIVYDREQQFETSNTSIEKQKVIVRRYETALTEIPETHLLSNGVYSMMITNSGSGYATKDNITLYRWNEDVTDDSKGMFFYIKNINSNEFWSNTYEPARIDGENYEVVFSLDKVEFKRKDGNITTCTDIAVSNEDNVEVRSISLTNHSSFDRIIEITSYLEVTLAPYSADIVHPAFSNLFIGTEFVESPMCIIAKRRPRAKGQKIPHLMQTVCVGSNLVGSLQYETSRANFIGRGRTLERPLVLDTDTPLKNTVGAVLDPIISIRVRVKVKAGETSKISYVTAVGDCREDMIEMALKYREQINVNRVFELAWTQSQVEMKYLGIKPTQANLYQLMASHILFVSTLLKSREKYIKSISKGQSALWAYGVSGDLPIVLLVVREDKDVDMVRQLIYAHEYWSIKGLRVDLVVLNLQNEGYVQKLQDSIRDLIASSYAREKQNKAGGIFIYNSSTICKEDINLLMGISRLVIDPLNGSLLTQIKSSDIVTKKTLPLIPSTSAVVYEAKKINLPKLEYYNEYGGFDLENNEYNILLREYKNTPAPWINVISNGDFGFHISESGVSYTWNKNSRENKITAWSNDPVCDGDGELIYLRDEESGEVWSITPKPIRDEGEYLIKYGFGYATFIHEAKGIKAEMTMFAPMDKSMKICAIKLINTTSIKRKISVTYYGRITMGVVPNQTAPYISTYINTENKYMFCKNPYNEHFGKYYVYLKSSGGIENSYTGDRKEFLGRCGSLADPLCLKNASLSNTCGSGFDPCIATQSKVVIEANKEANLTIILGEEEKIDVAEEVMLKYSNLKNVEQELLNVKEYWRNLLQTIQVKTPDNTMDIMLNGWLMYQVIACRLWARTAFYQSGGAYGFRDQLQDVMAAGYLDEKLVKNQILYSATRQFIEGDVQHWWHPIVESGIRTKFSDDLLWLPFVTADYIKKTGDYTILDEEVSYLEDNILGEHEDERYTISKKSEVKGSIYEHCIKTIDRGLKFGSHNIPLMGSGDWNDGMSTIGNEGKGESVWLGWFLYNILESFVEICKLKNDSENTQKYESYKTFIRENLEANAWDGSWYRRAYFDDGTPLGSAENEECQIDSLSQSWSVISGAAKPSRAKEAMEALDKYLINKENSIVQLLTPAFDKSSLEPGYIKGYVPGVRENGGQYTHAAVWVSIAMARMGNGDKAFEIFNMINPINHSRSHLDCLKYKVEPYVMAADVYAVEPHIGRGGWTWYTGAAGWMYKAGIEEILGLKLLGNIGFKVEPCIPKDWPGYEIKYKKYEATYNIKVTRGSINSTVFDGEIISDGIIPFVKNGEHEVTIVIK